jgi:hypothetical protein
MDRLNESKITQFITDVTSEQKKLFDDLREAKTIEEEKPIKAKLNEVNAMVQKFYNFRTILRKEKEKEV